LPIGQPTAIDAAAARHILIADQFQKLDDAWEIHVSKSNVRSSFENEGKIGEIYTPAHTAVFAQRKLPVGTEIVELTLDAGTDGSASWGPGIALLFANQTLKLHVRPSGGADDESPRLGAFDGVREIIKLKNSMKLDLAKPISLRIVIADAQIHCDAKQGEGSWSRQQSFRRDPRLGKPTAVRIGKMDRAGQGSDHAGEKGDLVRLRMLEFKAYGAIDKTQLAQQAESAKKPNSKLKVSVHYEMYDGVPVMAKWITLANDSDRDVTVDKIATEILAVVEHSSWVETRDGVDLPPPTSVHVETDFAFGGFNHGNANRHVVRWQSDPHYSTQVNYLKKTPALLTVSPQFGPDRDVKPGQSFSSYRTYELIYDSTNRDRRGLSLKRMYRTIAPWVTENPLMMHMRTANPQAVRQAIDQCSEVGFEMLILSFGSGFNIENDSPQYIAMWKEIAAYAKSKNVEIGGYSLLSSRRIGGGNDIVSPPGMRPTHGNCPALTSEWGQTYFKKLYNFFEQTGFKLLEHDGSYPGDVDITARPPLQKGKSDSRWAQWLIIRDYYQWCRANGIYLNVPDYYYLDGANKCGMGYREVNWSLPRSHQTIHTRQNIFDGTWEKTPSMGWMFVPLTQYHGGGAGATIQPLHQHLDHYEMMIASNLGCGVQACYRGPRLYDTEKTKAAVKKWVAWYKTHRDILESDVIHQASRRADGRDLDWIFHANSQIKEMGMLVVYNPRTVPIQKNIRLDLYYTGIEDRCKITSTDGSAESYILNRKFQIDLPVEIGPGQVKWFVVEKHE